MERYDFSAEADYLRAHPDPAQQALWTVLQHGAHGNFEFVVAVNNDIVHFLDRDRMLVVELEDEAHDHSDGYYRNLKRYERLADQGYHVIAIAAYTVLQNLDEVVETIAAYTPTQ